MDGFDDEEIARALALSVREAYKPSKTSDRKPEPKEIIEIPSSDEEDNNEDVQLQSDVQRAIEASKAQSASSSRTYSPQDSISPTISPPAISAPSMLVRSSNAFPFDRAQLERERLERQKRLRPDLVEAQSKPQLDNEDEETDENVNMNGRSAKRQRLSHNSSTAYHSNVPSSSTRPTTGKAPRATTSGTQSKEPADAYFWNGELRQTANKYVEPSKDTRPLFRLTDILAPRDEISFAIISAYCVDFPWMYSFFNPSTPVIIVAQDSQGNETMKEVLPNWIKTTPFLRGGRGCMHMKFMLIFYKTGRLRVVVSTANLLPIDWRDIENSVWVQDVPLRPRPIPHESKANDFPAAWTRILHSLNVAPALITMVKNGHTDLPISRLEDLRRKWDFSKVKIHLVPSLAGKHEGWPKVLQSGHVALMKAVRDSGARTPKGKELVLECQGSSIGTYSTQWVNEFYCSARGDSAEEWLDQPKSRRTKLPYPPIKILFPSDKTVKESALGEQGGGTMFCRRSQWEGAKFPRTLFHDSRSKSGGVLMHSKMIIATFRDTGPSSKGKAPQSDSETEPESDDEVVEVDAQGREEDKVIGWAYVGSHNFTPSAWGTLSGSGFNPILNNTNFELGIVFPLRSAEELERVACWERPPRKYVLGKDEPWMQSESAYFAEE
ncbi:unnamed protein product [Somion occarium]|uniref:Phospholipase D/nuclease n=1 Tax=Somion occarium TaxID=3059160 RepID=A0ABP1CUV9_9APHY